MSSELIIFLLIVLAVLILLTILGLFVYSGGLYTPSVTTGEPPLKGCQIAYKHLMGQYAGNDVGAAFTEVTSIAPNWKCLGIFYDNDKVSPKKRRCAVGCVIPPKPSEIEDLSNWEASKKLLEENKFSYFDLPSVDRAVLCTFPYTTPFSLWLAPGRVYPYIHEFIEIKSLCAYPMIELYQGCQIHYFTPLSKQDDFLVPEAVAAANDTSENFSTSGTGSSCSESGSESDAEPSESQVEAGVSAVTSIRRRRKQKKTTEETDENDSKPDLNEWEQVETVECASLDTSKNE